MGARGSGSGVAAGGPRLFAREELKLRPTGAARLRAIARRRPRGPLHREPVVEDLRTIDRLRRQGLELAGQFKLKAFCLERERQGVNEHYGICYEDGLIRIRLRHATTGKTLKESSLVDTLCHELAHLRHLNHGPGFRRLYRRILDRARELGYYRPGPEGGRRVRQASLFDGESCGTAPGGA